MNMRNLVILIGAVAIALIILGFVSTIMTQIVPLTIVAVVAFALGRMSASVNVLDVAKGLLTRTQASKDDGTASAAPARAESHPAPTTAEDKPADQPQAEEITDFNIKSEEDVLAEARRLEDEVSKRAEAYDPTAALEERRRRLLGDKANE